MLQKAAFPFSDGHFTVGKKGENRQMGYGRGRESTVKILSPGRSPEKLKDDILKRSLLS